MKKFLFALSFVLLFACAKKHVSLHSERPPVINIPDAEKMVVRNIKPLGDMETKRQAGLMQSELEKGLFKMRQFDLMDRGYFEELLAENGLSAIELEDPEKAAEVAEILDNVYVLSPQMLDVDYVEKLSEDEYKKDDETFYKKRRTAIATITMSYKLVSVETGEIVAMEELEVSTSFEKSSDKGAPPAFNKGQVLAECREKSVERFIALFDPREVVVSKYFRRIKGDDDFKKGLKYARQEEWALALPFFERAYEENPNDWEQVYNYGLALSCAGEYEKAVDILEDALLLDDNKDVARELKIAKGNLD